jgi:hypothetical protein
MSNVDSAERPGSHELVADLLSEARNLISRERTVEENNLLQIQHVIEAAQRELRRLRIRSEVDRFFAVGEAADAAVDGVDTDDSGEGTENRNDLDDAGNGSPDDGSGGVISAMASTGQICIIRPEQSRVSGAETRAEAVQTNAPLTEIDLYIGRTTAWTLPEFEELLQQIPGHEDTWIPAESSVEERQGQTESRPTEEAAEQIENAGVNGPSSSLDRECCYRCNWPIYGKHRPEWSASRTIICQLHRPARRTRNILESSKSREHIRPDASRWRYLGYKAKN